MKQRQTLFWAQGAMIAALYMVLASLSHLLGLSSGPIQCRLSEVLCILSVFTPAAIPGMTVGCLLFNIVTGCLPQDIVLGTLATFLGVTVGYFCKKLPYLVPLPTLIANTAIVPFILKYAYGLTNGIWYFVITCGIGEAISAYIGGICFYLALKPHSHRIFHK